VAILIKESNISQAWLELLRKLIRTGKPVSPRGIATLEILNVTLEVQHCLRNIIVNPIRNLNYRFMIAEWLWIQAGLNDVESISFYNQAIKQFSDDDQVLNGAYGPRLFPQWEYVIESLCKEGSRQSIAVIWTPSPGQSKDIPCTISLQWFIRQRKLHCTVNMRSSDVWLGLPYDYFTFSQLTNSIGRILQIDIGSMTMNLASSHLYDSNHNDACAAAWLPSDCVESPVLPFWVGFPKPRKMIKMLFQKSSLDLVRPWAEYADALKQNKKHALEVLRGLDPSK
jgi:thymidylate synthase